MADDSILAVLPVAGGIREERLEVFDIIIRLLQQPVDPTRL